MRRLGLLLFAAALWGCDATINVPPNQPGPADALFPPVPGPLPPRAR